MTKKKAKKTFLRKIGKPAGVFLAAAAIIGLFVLLFAWAEKHDRRSGCGRKDAGRKSTWSSRPAPRKRRSGSSR